MRLRVTLRVSFRVKIWIWVKARSKINGKACIEVIQKSSPNIHWLKQLGIYCKLFYRYGRPFQRIEEGNVYVPVLDEFNDWVQIGRYQSQTCGLHNQHLGPPLWGIDPDHCSSSDRMVS